MKLQQGLANRLGDRLANGLFRMEFDLAFGGVDVDIDLARIDFQKQTTDREPSLHQRGVVALDQREIKSAVFHRPAIDKKILVIARRAGNAGSAHQAPDMERGFGRGRAVSLLEGVKGKFCVQTDQVLPAAMEQLHALFEGGQPAGAIASLQCGHPPNGGLVLNESEGHLGKGQGGEGEIMLDVNPFGFLAAQKFPAGGQIEEQMAHLGAGSGRRAGGLDFEQFASVDDDLSRL